MAGNKGVLVVTADTTIHGKIRNCRQIDIYGYVEGEVAADKVMVHKDGRLFGKVRAESAEIQGTVQGTVQVRKLINIRSSGIVSGDIQYGQIALEAGADLTADVRNVPPSIEGDLNLAVYRGRSVGITMVDLSAVDPDNDDRDLQYSISNAVNGFVAFGDAPKRRVDGFTQADLEAGKMVFHHDGSAGSSASFDVVVADSSGSTSGAPRSVAVSVSNR